MQDFVIQDIVMDAASFKTALRLTCHSRQDKRPCVIHLVRDCLVSFIECVGMCD